MHCDISGYVLCYLIISYLYQLLLLVLKFLNFVLVFYVRLCIYSFQCPKNKTLTFQILLSHFTKPANDKYNMHVQLENYFNFFRSQILVRRPHNEVTVDETIVS